MKNDIGNKENFGYRPTASEQRGYQTKKIENGYQPSGADIVKPPKGGTGAVTPKKDS